MEIEKTNVLGVGISVIDQDRAREFLFECGAKRKARLRHGYRRSRRERSPERSAIEKHLEPVTSLHARRNADGVDGKSCRVIIRFGAFTARILCSIFAQTRSLRVFDIFFSAAHAGCRGIVAQMLQSRFPGINIAGTFSPPFRPLNAAEVAQLQDQVRTARPDFFWVGLSTPKQERFMATHLQLLPEAKIFIGVGAAFDLLTGRVRQAPRWIQRSGLEWFFRLTQEPGRLWKRYLVNNPLFIIRAGAQLLRLRKYLPEETLAL